MIDLSTPCRFLPNKPERNGYVNRGRRVPGKSRLAHRQAYEAAYGPIPDGWTVDHECHNADVTCLGGDTCRHRACINPLHLAAKPLPSNTAASPNTLGSINMAKTHCDSGHEFTVGNTYLGPAGDRQCRMCKLIWRQEQIRRQRAKQWGLS